MQGNLQPGKQSNTVLEGNRWDDQSFNVHTAMKISQDFTGKKNKFKSKTETTQS